MPYNAASSSVHRVLFVTILILVTSIALAAGWRPGTRADSSICLNEIFPKPCDSPFTDFVELYNLSGADINLSGWALVVNSTSFPLEGVVISHGYAVCTGFDLPAPSQGACVRLLDAAGSAVDQYCYRFPSCDLSFGRVPDGASYWSEGLVPRHASYGE